MPGNTDRRALRRGAWTSALIFTAVQLATGWVKNDDGEWVFDPIVAEEGGADDEQ